MPFRHKSPQFCMASCQKLGYFPAMKHKNQRKHSNKRGQPPQKNERAVRGTRPIRLVSSPDVAVFAETLKSGRGVLEIDLHGYTVQEAIETLEKTIDKAILSDVRQLNVVHGFGTGKIKTAVHKYLHNLKHVSSFRLSINNPGVTVVFL